MQKEHFECKSSDVNEKLQKLIKDHAPLKSKTVRENNNSLMNKDWKKKHLWKKRFKNISGTTKKRKEIFVQT